MSLKYGKRVSLLLVLALAVTGSPKAQNAYALGPWFPDLVFPEVVPTPAVRPDAKTTCSIKRSNSARDKRPTESPSAPRGIQKVPKFGSCAHQPSAKL